MNNVKNIRKHLLAGIFLAAALLLVVPNFVLAPQATYAQLIPSNQVNIGGTNAQGTDPVKTIGNLITYVGGFLVVIATLLVVYAGFQWMTAMGSEDKVKKAKTLLMQAVIGLIIILAASGVTSYVFTQLYKTVQ